MKSITSGPQVSSLCSRIFISPSSDISSSQSQVLFQSQSPPIQSNTNNNNTPNNNTPNTPIRWPTPNPPTISPFALESFRSALPSDERK